MSTVVPFSLLQVYTVEWKKEEEAQCENDKHPNRVEFFHRQLNKYFHFKLKKSEPLTFMNVFLTLIKHSIDSFLYF
jgi:hypothetical protein